MLLSISTKFIKYVLSISTNFLIVNSSNTTVFHSAKCQFSPTCRALSGKIIVVIRDCRIATTIFTIYQSELTKISCELLHRFAIALPFGVPVRVIGIGCAEYAYLPKFKGVKMFKSLREFTQFSLRFYSNLLRILLKSRCGYAMIGGCIVRPKCRWILAIRQPKEK